MKTFQAGQYKEQTNMDNPSHEAEPAYLSVIGTPGKEEMLKEALLKVVTQTHREPGNIQFDLYQSNDDPELFMLYENFVDPAALALHFEQAYTKELVNRFDELLAGPLVAWRLTKISQDNRFKTNKRIGQ